MNFLTKKVSVRFQTMASYHFLLWNFSFSLGLLRFSTAPTNTLLCFPYMLRPCLGPGEWLRKQEEAGMTHVTGVDANLMWFFGIDGWRRDLQLWVTQFGLFFTKMISSVSCSLLFSHFPPPPKAPFKHLFTSAPRWSITLPSLPIFPSPLVPAGQASSPQAFISCA